MFFQRTLVTLAPLLAAALLAGAFVACSSDIETPSGAGGSGGAGDSGGAGGSGAGDGLTAGTFCGAYAQAACGAIENCDCPPAQGMTTCAKKLAAGCQGSLIALIGAISLGEIAFDAASAQACIDTAATTLKTCVLPTERNKPAACGNYMQDLATLGAKCSMFGGNLPCAKGQGACTGMTGLCEPLPKDGEPCFSSHCVVGLVCDAGKCRPLQPKQGMCGSDLACKAGLVCVEGLCSEPQLKGAACTMESGCATGLGCIAGQCATAIAEGQGCDPVGCGAEGYCMPTPGLKKCAAKAQPGDACMQFDDCAAGATCDFMKAGPTCATLPKVGEPCPMFLCAGSATCSNGSCIVAPGNGEACAPDSPKPCAAPFGCDHSMILTGVCAAGKVGEACKGDEQACALGAVCDFMQQPPLCRTKGAAGATCDQNDSLCQDGLFCDQLSNMCALPLAVGKPCTSPVGCAAGAYCEFGPMGGVCTKLPSQLGDACSFMCGSDLRCTGPSGVCTKGACVIAQ